MASKKDELTTNLSKFVQEAQWNNAVEALAGLIKLEPTNAQYHLRMGDYSVKAGNKAAAVKSYFQAADMFAKAGFSVKGIATYKIILRIVPEEAQAAAKLQSLLAGDKIAEKGLDTFDQAVGHLEPLSFKDGECILGERDAGEAKFFISRGSVRVVTVGDDHKVLDELNEGEFFPGMSLIEGGVRDVSFVAIGPTMVYKLNSTNLFDILKDI
jgi:tetratricopeptide (TPR) repeat protein